MKFTSHLVFLFYLPIIPTLFGNTTADYLQEPLEIKTIESTDWEQATEGLDYGVTKKLQPPPKPTTANTELLGTILKILAIIAVVIMIIFLLYSFVGIQGIPKGKNQTFDPNEIINTQTIAENIHEFDLASLIQQAIQQQDYTVATRLYYLLAIKTLSEKDLIKWTKDKTNRSYLNELTTSSTKNKFRNLTNIFERVWYGEVAVNQSIFKEIEGQFQVFIEKIDGSSGSSSSSSS